ncbi:hypothetical protein [Brevibacillus sp. SYSU BS000544]|uniref:hypothetical protein n=1 Tax=Brevibacillus sp. SYSU BS000544 TaxID=3416443 RepID=UPI003CE4D37A
MYTVDIRNVFGVMRTLSEMGAPYRWRLRGWRTVTVRLGNMPARTYDIAHKFLVDNLR